VLAELGLGLGLHEVINLLIWVTGTLTIVSAAVYFWQWLGHMASYEPAPAPLPPRQRKAASLDRPQSSRARAS
jgi:cardiolipin synthase